MRRIAQKCGTNKQLMKAVTDKALGSVRAKYDEVYGVLEHEGERELVALPDYDLCLGETIEEAVELGKLKNGQYSFIWSPPGASNLPIELIWRVSKSKPARQNVKS